jgi:hypothetical protein
MKTYRHLRILDRKFLVALIILITLAGLSLKLKAQSPQLGDDLTKITSSMKIKLNEHSFDILVPKVEKNNLSAFEDVRFQQIVYVTDENPGFYLFLNNQWEQQSVRSLLVSIDMNLKIKTPQLEDVILESGTEGSRQLLDYNSHIAHLYSGFTFEEGSTQMAILIN